jgi:hypothetical protein
MGWGPTTSLDPFPPKLKLSTALWGKYRHRTLGCPKLSHVYHQTPLMPA